MRELIPSKDVRNYLQKIGREFNDFECAIVIYNSDWNLNEKHQALTEILENTKDEVLRGQIQDRIERDKGCITKIKFMPGNLIIKLEVWEAMDSEYQFAGYFETFALAEGYASGCGRKCKIEVFELEKAVAWNEDNWGESEIAYVLYDEQGEITYYWTETCTETKDLECKNIIADGVPEMLDFMEEVLPKQEHQEEFRESLLDIVIDASQYLPWENNKL